MKKVLLTLFVVLVLITPATAFGAVAFDNAMDNGSASNATLGSFALTDATGHGMVIVRLLGDTASDCATGITFNGNAMTQASKKHANSTDRWMYTYYLGGLSSQTGNIVASGCTFNNLKAQSYSGAASTLDNSNTQEHSGGGNFTSSTFSITCNTTGSIVTMWTYWNGASAGSGATQRSTSSGSQTMFDSLSSTATAGVAYNMSVTTPSDNYLAAEQECIAPFSAPAAAAGLIRFFTQWW